MTTPSMEPMTRIGIIAKAHLSAAASHLVDIAQWLEERGVEAIFETDTATLMPDSPSRLVADKQALATGVGMVLVLGGDGTLLGMADCIGEAGTGIPLLGVNFGSLGFLTEITLPELYPSLEAALSGQVHVEERAMLQCVGTREGAEFARHIALNDAVITKSARSRMVDLVGLGRRRIRHSRQSRRLDRRDADRLDCLQSRRRGPDRAALSGCVDHHAHRTAHAHQPPRGDSGDRDRTRAADRRGAR